MRFRLLLYFLLPIAASAQLAPVRIAEQQLNYIRQNLDSLDEMVKNGQAVLFNCTCLLPEHRLFVMKDKGLSFSYDAKLVKGKKKEAYIKMMALKTSALQLYDRKDYQQSVIYWRKAFEIASEEGFIFDEIHD